MIAKPGKFQSAGLFALGLMIALPVKAEEGAPLFAPEGNSTTQPQTSPDASAAGPSDPSLTTHETAVECAVAVIIESAAERHVQLSNPAGNGFKAGLCTGKIQSYMLEAKAQNPDCFPKIELEEGIRIFVKWVEAHPEESETLYPDGFKKAFEDAVPCLKRG